MQNLKVYEIKANKIYYVAATSKKNAIKLLDQLNTNDITEINQLKNEDLNKEFNMMYLGKTSFVKILEGLPRPMCLCTLIEAI
jgi:hypothetical protein